MKIDNLNDTLESGIESLKNMINKIISSEELDTTLFKKRKYCPCYCRYGKWLCKEGKFNEFSHK